MDCSMFRPGNTLPSFSAAYVSEIQPGSAVWRQSLRKQLPSLQRTRTKLITTGPQVNMRNLDR
jgi:hypothetical protein